MNRKLNPDQAADKEWHKGGVKFWDVFCGVVERVVFLCPKLYSINARDTSKLKQLVIHPERSSLHRLQY